jgi:protein-L-isoaspartate(D-aspartate) O-methyltransferase
MSGASFEALRQAMVAEQLRARGIHDERVLAAMGAVPRERFVAARLRRRAYDDGALPIGERQTISQPWVVAAICQALNLSGEEHVLEVGTGSGYSAAVLARLAGQVASVERIQSLASLARERLADLGVENVVVEEGDGSAEAPGPGQFDAIAVHAAAPRVPGSLAARLAEGGRLVIPIAAPGADMLTAFVRRADGLLVDHVVGPCRFVPLIGADAFGG